MAHTNRLAGETSPYLLQHAHNPVDWFPWGEEAFERARRESKPILLSIGYSACHWCHVMAHESFEDAETAESMNAQFVSVKVDREERPDLDKIYQLAHQILNQRGGGWPLTVFLDPRDRTPFFSGTYFPPQPRHGLPSFREVLRQVGQYYHQRPEHIADDRRALQNVFRSLEAKAAASTPDDAVLSRGRAALAADYDPVHGGFGAAPKFPHPGSLEFLLRCWFGSGQRDAEALAMVLHTLERMAAGGIYDQLGGGFCRYAVDGRWEIPHFEKMLYDNGPLLTLCSQAWRIAGDADFQSVALATARWATEEMQSAEGGFYSALDADSEGEEGRFYVWDADEARCALTPEEWAVVQRHYGFDRPANFEDHWHLRVVRPMNEVAVELGVTRDEAQNRLQTARDKLLVLRSHRVRPGRDEKVLTSWNALMIRGMVVAGQTLARVDLTDSAARAFDFLHRNLWREGRLYASWKDGRARFPAYLDDYAFLLDAGLELLQARWDTARLRWLIELAEVLLAHFEDADQGGFFFTADDHEALIHRPKPLMDESLPSGNGVAALALARLGHVLGETRYLQAAERTLRAAADALRRLPHAHCALLNALDEYLEPPQVIVLRGAPEAMAGWRSEILNSWHPRRLCFAIPASETLLPGLLAERRPLDEGVVAYLCSGTACQAPVDSLEELKNRIAT
ncbi:MAG TPA: thioredoxin domain-containing protein [Methylococcaceae bacterium]|nr:thioredoxin domain-containing protein [Methylococcaceae bacterium]